ncbi:hypothetical protein [Sphaerospermopsis kisseleviana]|uniref:hypothetical protein n=1 Tax=Sphaerospermopsis kisseleviana TaxID=289435 RepID=UPI00232F486F|nr:hypothetical protein [Sphaerospermopsis kisseleviana]
MNYPQYLKKCAFFWILRDRKEIFQPPPDSCTGVREACWKHQHSDDKLSIFITGYFPVRAKHSDDKLSIFITGYFPVRAKHSDDKLSIFITGYFPNASPLRLLTPIPS